MTPKFVLLLCALIFARVADFAYAAGGDPAAVQAQTLTTSLLKAMRAGPAVSVTERYRKLAPVIECVFALPLMTRLSVGPDWSSFPPKQQRALVAAFSRYTIANYAHNFRKYNGQTFEVDENVVTRGKDKIVRTLLTSPHGTPASLLYRMREVDGTWKVVDVYYNGVSQLVLHRVDFASAVASGGAPALTAYLDKVSRGLMK